MAISDFIALSISLQDATPKAIEFNTPLIMADAPYIGARLYNCSPNGLAAMVTDGFSINSRAYQLMTTLASQSGGAAKAYIFNRTTQHTQILELIPTNLAVGAKYEFNVTYDGVTTAISFTVTTGTVAAICTGLHALLDPLAGFTSADGTTKVTLTSSTPGKFIQLQGIPLGLSCEEVGIDAGIAAQLAAAQVELGEAFYGLMLDSYAETEINLAAVFAEANRKLHVAVAPDGEIIDAGQVDDIGSDLKLAGYHRSCVFMTRQMHANEHAGWLGRQLGRKPGSSNWAKKNLAGVTASNFTATELAAAKAKNVNLYAGERGLSFTRSGRAASGRPFDLTHGLDAMHNDIETELLTLMVNNEKLPYTEEGIRAIKTTIEGVLTRYEKDKFINSGWFVTTPLLADISAANKANRALPDVTFSCVASGAIDSITVAGTITL